MSGVRDSKGMSELPQIQLILSGKISCIRDSLEIPLQSLECSNEDHLSNIVLRIPDSIERNTKSVYGESRLLRKPTWSPTKSFMKVTILQEEQHFWQNVTNLSANIEKIEK